MEKFQVGNAVKTFGQMLQERREALGWSAETLAFHASVSGRQVRNLEAGRSLKPHASTIKVLEDALALGERRRVARAKERAR
jgi:ribosome-binding protein aMBF1 (putative translation factor)